jgi:hypothetical protein
VFIEQIVLLLGQDSCEGVRYSALTATAGSKMLTVPHHSQDRCLPGSATHRRLEWTFAAQYPYRRATTVGSVSNCTRILHTIEEGDAEAADQFLPLIDEELRLPATHGLSQQNDSQALQERLR